MTLFQRTDRDHDDCPVCKALGRASAPDVEADGYGWPPFLPWGVTEEIIDQMIADDGIETIGDPFVAQMSTGAGVEEYPAAGPLGLVYLAGPMRGIEAFNFPAFHAAAAGLRGQGWGVFDPAAVDEMGGFDATGLTGNEDLSTLGFSLREALGKDLEFITSRADAVAVLPGWENSKGARAEVATARALGLPVFDALEGASRPVTGGEPVGSARVRLADWIEEAARLTDHPTDPATDSMIVAEVKADGEIRTTSSTGGQKGKKPEQYDQIPTKALAELARHFGAGADKYAAHNFRKGYAWSLCFNALMRHALLFWGGEDYDVHRPECPADCVDHLPKSKHITAVAWHALALATFMDEHPEFDDRYKPEVSA